MENSIESLQVADLPAGKLYTSIRSKEGTLPFVELDGVEYDDSGEFKFIEK